MTSADSLLFKNATLFDGERELGDGISVLTEGNRIREISDTPIRFQAAKIFDLAGRTLIPGLIDVHFHAYATDLDIARSNTDPAPLHALEAHVLLENALLRGFTTIRDAGGADYGLATACEMGLIKPSALADLLVVDVNPLDDIGVLRGQRERISVIAKDWQIVKCELT